MSNEDVHDGPNEHHPFYIPKTPKQNQRACDDAGPRAAPDDRVEVLTLNGERIGELID